MKQSGTTKKTARKTGKRVSELEGLATRTGVRQQTSGLIRIGAQISRSLPMPVARGMDLTGGSCNGVGSWSAVWNLHNAQS